MNARYSQLVVLALALGGFAPNAFAYLDPSTGSMILSAIVGLFATAGLALKTYWYRLKSLFRGNTPAAAEGQRDDDTTEAQRESEQA